MYCLVYYLCNFCTWLCRFFHSARHPPNPRVSMHRRVAPNCWVGSQFEQALDHHREGLKLLKGQLFQQATASASKVFVCFAQLSHASRDSHACANLATSTTMCTWCGCEDLSQEVCKKKGKVQKERIYRSQDVSILFKGI